MHSISASAAARRGFGPRQAIFSHQGERKYAQIRWIEADIAIGVHEFSLDRKRVQRVFWHQIPDACSPVDQFRFSIQLHSDLAGYSYQSVELDASDPRSGHKV